MQQAHIDKSIRHYNDNYAHRFDWSFTRDRFREWWNRCKTSSTGYYVIKVGAKRKGDEEQVQAFRIALEVEFRPE